MIMIDINIYEKIVTFLFWTLYEFRNLGSKNSNDSKGRLVATELES